MRRTRSSHAFTLVELIVSISVLTVLVLFIARLLNSATVVTTSGNKRMDLDAQTRALLDRIGVDFAQMVKRTDVDYYLKLANTQAGNDQVAFYSLVQGYSSMATSPIALIAYRIDSGQQMTRMAKGLIWNGTSPAASPSPTPAPLQFGSGAISTNWPAATNDAADPDYEAIAPSVFRFEYYYLLKNGALSDTPWDTAVHADVSGLQDVAAIAVTIAAIDPQSRVLVSDSQLSALAATMTDFNADMKPGELLGGWQTAVNGTTTVPRSALSGIRCYERQFQLLPKL